MVSGSANTVERPAARAALPAATCHVWWARPSDADPGWAEVLDPDERARLAELPHARARQRYLAAHALCRSVLAAYLGTAPAVLRFDARCPACGGPHGKPRLLDPADLEFSLSRTGDRLAVAVARHPVGMDVEEFGRVSDQAAMVDMFLRPEEQAQVDALGAERRPAAFLRYWTRKEAVLKALGVGRSVPPNRLHVSRPDERPELLGCDLEPGPSAAVQLYDLTPGGGAAACLAVLSDVTYRVEVMAGTHLLRR